MFKFSFSTGALAGQAFWATPGGALEDGESFRLAARRELEEETGIRVDDVGPEVGRREFELQLADGEMVMADERFFIVRFEGGVLSREGWTAEEQAVLAEWRWWSEADLATTEETVWPEDLLGLLRRQAASG